MLRQAQHDISNTYLDKHNVFNSICSSVMLSEVEASLLLV